MSNVHWGRKKPRSNWDSWWAQGLAYLTVAVLFGACYAAYGEWAYDDWTCAFKNCRVMK